MALSDLADSARRGFKRFNFRPSHLSYGNMETIACFLGAAFVESGGDHGEPAISQFLADRYGLSSFQEALACGAGWDNVSGFYRRKYPEAWEAGRALHEELFGKKGEGA